MTAVSRKVLPVGSEWSYEVKWDGYRAQAVKRGDAVTLVSRNGKDLTKQFPSVASALRTVRARNAVLDGEIVALDAHGRPSFQALHHWDIAGLVVVYYAFDLLHIDGREVVREPLDRRRAQLKGAVDGSQILLSEPLPGTPGQIEAAIKRMKLEGIVAKRRDSMYEPGRRSEAWVKVRFAQRQEFVVGGFRPLTDGFDSIVVGYYAGPKTRATRLMCAGKVRNGITPHSRALLLHRLAPLVIRKCPFVNLPSTRAGRWGEGITAEEMTTLRWVKPLTVVEVSFVEWTRDGSLRHAAFEGIRDDKTAQDVVRES
jgi:bifunctional non-homologous end joining protein LigD